jgi:hypothetical protein
MRLLHSTTNRGRKAALYSDRLRSQFRVQFYLNGEHLGDYTTGSEADACDAINAFMVSRIDQALANCWAWAGGEPTSRG